MNYWASAEDPTFVCGHYVEDWEVAKAEALSAPIRQLLREEALVGNKIKFIAHRSVELDRPPTCGVLALPEGVVFCCPLRRDGLPRLDGDEDGVIMHLESGQRVFPTGLESPAE